jgi:hypothetical protein
MSDRGVGSYTPNRKPRRGRGGTPRGTPRGGGQSSTGTGRTHIGILHSFSFYETKHYNKIHEELNRNKDN